MKIYNKRVRDKIPEIIKSEGREVKARTLTNEEYKKEFRAFIEQEIENNKDCPALVGFIKKAYLR